MFNQLPDKDYIGLVVGGSNDINHRGAVRCKILGVTEEYEDDEQPYVYPAITTGIQQVPQVGYYLRIRFMHGDVNAGYYYGMSQTQDVAPAAFTEYYPDVAMANLGEDGFFYTHNRQTHITDIVNPGNNSTLTWDASGFVTYESGTAHAQAGMGAKEGTGENLQHVLTEGTIDIFTCMPVGHNRANSGIGQGSEYLTISHISQATIDAFNGQGQPTDTGNSPQQPQTEADIPKIDIINKSGEVVDTVPMERTDQMIKRNGKEIKRILVCHSEGECFPIMAKKFMESSSTAHYLVGKVAGQPEVLSDGNSDKDSLKNSGFVQFIDLEDDGGVYSGSTINGDKANVDSVIIMCIGSATDSLTPYQMGILDKLVTHIRAKAKNDDIPVVSPNDFDIKKPTALMPTFDGDDYNGG